MKYTTITLAILISTSAFAQNAFSLNLSPTVADVSNVSVLLSYTESGSTAGFAAPVGLTATAGTTTVTDFSTNVALDTLQYGFLGTYGAEGVTIGIDSAVADSVIGQTWEQIFSNPLFAEANVRNAISTNNFGLQQLFADYLTTVQVSVGGTNRDLFAGIGQEVTLVNFSTASRNGAGRLTPVPEPASMIALGAGVLAVLRRRKQA